MTDGASDDTPDGSMADRVAAGRAKSWVLIDGDRRVVTLALAAVVFLALVAVGVVWPSSVRRVLESGDPVETLFQAMVTAIITGVTLVVTINQLVLAQELGSVGDQRDRMAGSLSFRSEAADHIDDPVSPADPASFLAALLSTVRERALTLKQGGAGAAEDDARTVVASFGSQTAADADRAVKRLAGTEFGTFAVTRAALDFDYSGRIYEGNRLAETRGEELPADDRRALADLLDTLEVFGTAREHVKTLYFQWELIALSRVILYAAVPALVTATAMILFFEGPASVPGTTLGVEHALWVVTGATLVSLTPFLVFIAYIFRIITVAKRTLAIGPFVLQAADDDAVADGIAGDGRPGHED